MKVYAGGLKGTTRVKFSNSPNLWKPHDNNVDIGYTCFKGTPGVLKHYSGSPMTNPGGPLK